jgi:Predicted acyltransferases
MLDTVNDKKLDYIDALRGLAITGVLFTHIGVNSHLPLFIQKIIAGGAMGVQLFFIVSAFTLFLSLDKKIGQEKCLKLNFFLRRFFRIAPMYYLGIIYFLWQNDFTASLLGDKIIASPTNILANFLFLHGLSPFWINSLVPGGWTITVEMTFYCFVPYLFKKIKNAEQAFNFLLISLFIRLFSNFILNKIITIDNAELWKAYLSSYLLNQLPIFALGIIMYFVIKNNSAKTLFTAKNIFLSAIILMANFLILKEFIPEFFLFGIVFLILGVFLNKNRIKTIVNPLFIFMGKISYSMYLVHFAVIYWLGRTEIIDHLPVNGIFKYLLRILLLFIATILIAAISYRFIEKPTQKLGKKLIQKIYKHDLKLKSVC